MTTRTIQYTGERTGKAEQLVPRHGLVRVGDVIEVPEEVADAYTRPLPCADGAMRADFADQAAVPLSAGEAATEDADQDEPEEDQPADPADTTSPDEGPNAEGETL